MSAYLEGTSKVQGAAGSIGGIYASEMSTNILLEKRARKLAEEDAARLYNRVRQLQKEEEKAGKRISETRKKAREIVRLRERNQLIKQEKQLRMQQLDELIEQQKLENQRLKEETLRNRIETENKVFAEKIATAQQTKEDKEDIARTLKENQLLLRKEALENKEIIRKQQEDARRKLEELKIARLHMAQDDYEKRLREEMEAKTQKEMEIEELAALEMELIERLRAKQLEQQKAFSQLEAVLSLGAASPGKGSPNKQAPASPSKPLAEPEEEDVARAFSVYDQDGTGKISASDVGGEALFVRRMASKCELCSFHL
uniref:EF-hand domain-containing protein n=1 Tax=Chlamydomonas euryale TaxID=1486919 RepID=A0A7R9YRY9_9CHLO